VEQRMMLAGTCQIFVSDIAERTLREAIRKQQQEHRVVHTDMRREVEWSGMQSAECRINEARSSDE
jgi:transposase-like protein